MGKELLRIFCVLLLICSGCLISCSSDDEHVEEPIQEEVRYYVKYEVGISKYRPTGTISIQCQGDKKVEEYFIKGSGWEETFGPFKKGQKVFLKASYDSGLSVTGDSYVKISVSRNKEPFVLRAEDRRSDGSHEYEVSATVE